ncbi:MAG: signal recognition particle-docking protein FtsY [Deltaproteobacteria bacterium]|jgi:fused signal recognition particle receptor|nr:signal recognition particle-docking protein FtsY [Deltaproteobacteria bacterium]MBT6491307.1 signal recognition particle-docking protein FtsY [Deltaproteobacteria bacterium]
MPATSGCMNGEMIGMIVLASLTVGFVWLAFKAIKRSAERKKELYAEEDSAEFAEPTAQVAPKAEPEPVVEAVPEPEPVVEAAAEPESVVEAAAEPEPVVEAAAEPEPVVEAAPAGDDLRLKEGMKRTNASFMGKLASIFSRKGSVDDDVMDELEEALLTADVGVRLAMEMVDDLRARVASKDLSSGEEVRAALREHIEKALDKVSNDDDPLAKEPNGSKVILFIGVNGVGKTTSIGKIASLLKSRGHSVVMGAGDTFRAAAVEQLKVWGERTDCKVITGDEGSDPASVIYNTVRHGCEVNADFILADTAGRLHTKNDLMEELKKVGRAAGKSLDGAPHETWLVVDGTTGQNAVLQARQFNEAVGLTGVILTKLDGTAKGGVVVGIANELAIPVRFVGVGEQADDLRPFHAPSFVNGLFESSAA